MAAEARRTKGCGAPAGRAVVVLFAWLAAAALPASSARLSAQESDRTDRDEERARVLARADSARRALVQPPGSREGLTAMDVVRVPFQIVGGALGLVATTGEGALQLALLVGVDPVALMADDDEDDEDGGGGFAVGADFIGSRSGPALVVGWEGLGLFADAAYSYRGYQRYRVGAELGDTLAGAALAGSFRRLRALHFWGVGPDAAAADRSDLAQDRLTLLAGGTLRVADPLALTASLGFDRTEPGRGTDDSRPDAVDVFDPGEIYGLTETTEYLRLGGGVRIPWLTVRDLQPSGLDLRADHTWFRGASGTDSDFHRVEAELRGYVPVSARHLLAFRAMGEDHLGEEGRGVPMVHLAELGDDDGLRGYRSRRFRDRAIAAVSAEWRYEVWWQPGLPDWRVEGFAFADYGGVGSSFDALSLSDFDMTPGVGLRLVQAGAGLAEVFAAFGGEETRLDASFGVTF